MCVDNELIGYRVVADRAEIESGKIAVASNTYLLYRNDSIAIKSICGILCVIFHQSNRCAVGLAARGLYRHNKMVYSQNRAINSVGGEVSDFALITTANRHFKHLYHHRKIRPSNIAHRLKTFNRQCGESVGGKHYVFHRGSRRSKAELDFSIIASLYFIVLSRGVYSHEA